MINVHDIEITTRDRLMRAWENSMELTRDYQMYSQHIDNPKISEMFKDFAENEAVHAQKLHSLLKKED